MANTKPSFIRGLFAGEIYDELIFPYPPRLDTTNPDEARTVRTLIAALEDGLGGMIDSVKFDAEETIGDNVIAALARHGFLGMTIPKRYGGLGLSPTGYARVFESLAAADPSLGVFIGVHCGLGSKAIAMYGTEAQQERWLPRLARGEILVAYALTEPDIGSDAQHIKTMAVRSGDGAAWTLNGEKIWIGNGHRASVLVTFAQTEVVRRGKPALRPTAFLIEPGMAGFQVVETVHKLGIRGSTQAQLKYTNMTVPAENVLGEVGKGFLVAVNVLNAGRLSLAAGCTGGAKALLGEMTVYAEQRVQFGSPLSTFEITQRKLAMLAAEAYAADAMLGVTAHLATKDDADWSLEAAIGKVFASELVWRAADEMVQIAGGRGFVKPYPYERHLRDSRINRIFEGANEILRLFIALNGLQNPSEQLRELRDALREPMKNLGLLSDYAALRVKTALGSSVPLDVRLHPRLKTHKEFLEKHVRELATATERAIVKYRKDIIHRQLVVERLANIAIELFATACVLSRTQSVIDERGVDGCAGELALCDLFCVEAGRRVRAARQALDVQEDEVDETRREVAKAVREAKGYFSDDAILL
jgi:alkylation response protein AidB-like acyl-CoA dehydrogenase